MSAVFALSLLLVSNVLLALTPDEKKGLDISVVSKKRV